MARRPEQRPLRDRAFGLESLEPRRLFAALYTVTDLGPLLPEATSVIGYGFNSAGQVVGGSSTDGTAGAPPVANGFLYDKGQVQRLTFSSPAGYTTAGRAVNNSGQIAGWRSASPGVSEGVVESNRTVTAIPSTDGSGDVTPAAINNTGLVAGYLSSTLVPGSTDAPVTRAFLYSGGASADIGTLGGTQAAAYAINNAGQVAGESTTRAGANDVFLYGTDHVMHDLGFSGTPLGLNDNTQVVGALYRGADRKGPLALRKDYDNHPQAFVYSGGETRPIAGPDSYAAGINKAGEVVGTWLLGRYRYFATGERAFVYRDGKTWDLSSLIDPALGITLEEAVAVNDAGQILVNGTTDSQGGFLVDGPSDCYVLTPINSAPSLIGTLGREGESVGGPEGTASALASPSVSFRQPDGSGVTVTLRGGSGFVFRNASDPTAIDLQLQGNCSLTIRSRGGPSRLRLGTVAVSGTLISLAAPDADLTGTFLVTGPVGAVTLGDVSGVIGSERAIGQFTARDLSGTLLGQRGLGVVRLAAVTGNVTSGNRIESLSAQSLSGATIVAGDCEGVSQIEALPGGNQMLYTTLSGPGIIGSVTASGKMTAATIVTTTLVLQSSTYYHRFLGSVRSIVARGGADADCYFDSSHYAAVYLPGRVDTSKDNRFDSGLEEVIDVGPGGGIN